ncbi:hypothetical protein E2C01_095321 [Portunus trituberculatus]|uniref:Uncharacterized protein n=1 Tax=Portunus trituberculatus TaxID=210409 RepID=A0A5B7JZW0_PORTR|nr:hypothetical protein [Portunus trituberculatus]
MILLPPTFKRIDSLLFLLRSGLFTFLPCAGSFSQARDAHEDLDSSFYDTLLPAVPYRAVPPEPYQMIVTKGKFMW